MVVADTAAERMRRSRKHKSGDHTECRRERCAYAGRPAAPAGIPAGARAQVISTQMADGYDPPSTSLNPAADGRVLIQPGVEAFVRVLNFEEGDPRSLLGNLAVQLARRVDETNAVPATVRELRIMLMQLAEIPNGPAGKVDEQRVQRAVRQLDAILAAAVR